MESKRIYKHENYSNPKHDGVLTFDVIKEYDDVSLTNDFTRYKYFVHNLDLVNKVSKSIKNLGFIPIKTSDSCPSVNCKNFSYKVASQKCTLLQVHFVQCCKL